MKQGDGIFLKSGQSFLGGTLGGFVIDKNNIKKMYALTCNHLFPQKDLPAYDEKFNHEIGKCVFTTREHFLDFAAIEMHEIVDCDVTFRGSDGRKTNARVYEDDVRKFGFVHKNGACTGSTTGVIVSSEYYEKSLDYDSTGLFLVSGANGCAFADSGDSGSLVFSRPLGVKQNHVNVIGMVIGHSVVIYENEDDEDASFLSENITCCSRISPALDLFKVQLNIDVKFKDDLPFSSSSEDSS